MGRSFLLAWIAGIKILLHWTFLLLLGFIVFSEIRRGGDATALLATVGFVVALFGCVVLHELGHSLTARRKLKAFYPVLENERFRGVTDQNNIDEFPKIRAALSH